MTGDGVWPLIGNGVWPLTCDKQRCRGLIVCEIKVAVPPLDLLKLFDWSQNNLTKGGTTMYYVGCDLHKATTYFYVVDKQGKCIANKSIANEPELLNTFLSSIPTPFELAVEATYNWYFFIDIVEKWAQKCYLTNPLYLKAFARKNKKTDKIDAKLIANILRVGYLPEVYIVNKDIRIQREVLRQRMKIVQDRCRVIYRLKALLDKLGENSNGNFATGRRLAAIETAHLPKEYACIIEEYKDQIINLVSSEHRTDKIVKELVNADLESKILTSIDGVGDFSALLIRSEIADVKRFRDFDSLCSYAGLAPRVNQSGNKCIIGSISKNRRKHLQWILLEIVPIFVNKNEHYKQKFEKIKNGKGYNKARVVLARDLLKIVYRVLRTKEPYYNRENIRTMAPCAVSVV
jgi:transposase